jgi:hypothetical protein
MGLGRNWTKEEEEFLCENWGKLSVPTLCERLNRSKNAVIVRVNRLGLPAFLDAGDYVTLNQLSIAVTGSNNAYSYKTTSWVKNRGLPVHNKRVNNCSFKIVYIDEFWKWAEKNRSFIDFSKMEPLALGEEPLWVSEQRKKDFSALALQRKDPWTPIDDQRLIHLLKQHKYGYADLSKMLQRSAGAIQRRCTDLGLKERPVKADNHTPWSEDDYAALADGIRSGASYTEIGLLISRSEKAIRGRVYEAYRTEVADKVREMLGNGLWGSGAPELTVWEARRKAAVKQDLSQLLVLLKMQRNALGYEAFWQKDMCMNWDPIEGCMVGCSGCDDCGNAFQRIPAQYCVRCGITFYDRQKDLRCPRCREQRRKQAARKYYAQNKK